MRAEAGYAALWAHIPPCRRQHAQHRLAIACNNLLACLLFCLHPQPKHTHATKCRAISLQGRVVTVFSLQVTLACAAWRTSACRAAKLAALSLHLKASLLSQSQVHSHLHHGRSIPELASSQLLAQALLLHQPRACGDGLRCHCQASLAHIPAHQTRQPYTLRHRCRGQLNRVRTGSTPWQRAPPAAARPAALGTGTPALQSGRRRLPLVSQRTPSYSQTGLRHSQAL